MRPVVLGLIAAQLALPGAMLTARWTAEGSRPVTEYPASWQMYSVVPPVAYTGVDADGAERALDTDDLPPVLRRIDTGRVVPDRLCARAPRLREVVRRGGTQPGRFRCP